MECWKDALDQWASGEQPVVSQTLGARQPWMCHTA